MGRPPIGKTAMTGAERVRRYRLKHGTDKPVTKPASPKPASPDHAALVKELAQAKARVAELENKNAALVKKLEQAVAHFRKTSANAHELEARVADVVAENDVLKSEIIALKKERQTFRDDRPVTKQPAQHEAEAEIAALRARIVELEQELEGSRKVVANAHRFIAAAEETLDRKSRTVPHDVYQTLFRSAHPDRVTDPKLKARYEKAFVFLKEHERALAKKKPPPKPPGLPRTLAEWDAAKWHAREERKAKRAATRAAKAPRKHLPKT